MANRVLLFITAVIFAIVGIRYVWIIYPRVTGECSLTLLNDNSSYRYCEVTDTNKMTCDLATVSDVIYDMQLDGYIIYQQESTEDYIDIILQKDELYIRIHYEVVGSFVSIASEYEKSYIPVSYISG